MAPTLFGRLPALQRKTRDFEFGRNAPRAPTLACHLLPSALCHDTRSKVGFDRWLRRLGCQCRNIEPEDWVGGLCGSVAEGNNLSRLILVKGLLFSCFKVRVGMWAVSFTSGWGTSNTRPAASTYVAPWAWTSFPYNLVSLR